MKKRIFIKNILEKKEYQIQIESSMGDFSFEINSLNILERNKQLDYLENSLFIQDYIIILEDWYKSLKPAIGVKDNEGNRNKLYLGKNNVKSYW